MNHRILLAATFLAGAIALPAAAQTSANAGDTTKMTNGAPASDADAPHAAPTPQVTTGDNGNTQMAMPSSQNGQGSSTQTAMNSNDTGAINAVPDASKKYSAKTRMADNRKEADITKQLNQAGQGSSTAVQ